MARAGNKKSAVMYAAAAALVVLLSAAAVPTADAAAAAPITMPATSRRLKQVGNALPAAPPQIATITSLDDLAKLANDAVVAIIGDPQELQAIAPRAQQAAPAAGATSAAPAAKSGGATAPAAKKVVIVPASKVQAAMARVAPAPAPLPKPRLAVATTRFVVARAPATIQVSRCCKLIQCKHLCRRRQPTQSDGPARRADQLHTSVEPFKAGFAHVQKTFQPANAYDFFLPLQRFGHLSQTLQTRQRIFFAAFATKPANTTPRPPCYVYFMMVMIMCLTKGL